MNKNTAAGLWAACVQVQGVLDDPDQADVVSIDIEDLLTRFQNLRKQRFKPQVLEAYKRRSRNAVKSYKDYLENPGAWKPATQERSGCPDRRSPPSNAPASGGLRHPHREARILINDFFCHIHVYSKYNCTLDAINK
jgi:hypothetical protein